MRVLEVETWEIGAKVSCYVACVVIPISNVPLELSLCYSYLLATFQVQRCCIVITGKHGIKICRTCIVVLEVTVVYYYNLIIILIVTKGFIAVLYVQSTLNPREVNCETSLLSTQVHIFKLTRARLGWIIERDRSK